MPAMPEFSLEGYHRLLIDLIGAGYRLEPVSMMPEPVAGRTAYLRHDIDLHIPGVDRIAEIEAVLGVRSTYYVLLTQHYNPVFPQNRTVLRHIAELGHEIGLHYDLTTYPVDEAAALRHLLWECSVLEAVVGKPVKTISMHQPYEGRPDILRQVPGLVHPHDPRLAEGLLYVSDSCRAWRDESLLQCFGPDAPQRLLFLAHPELWLAGAVTDRMRFLSDVVRPNALRQHEEFIDTTVRCVWERHQGPRLHDAREAARSQGHEAGRLAPAE